MPYLTIESGEYTPPKSPSRNHAKIMAIADRDGLYCRYCCIPLFPSDEIQKHLIPAPFRNSRGQIMNAGKLPDTIRMATVDHVVPLSLGGTDMADNLVLACAKCNASKGNRHTYEQFLAKKRMEVAK